MTCEERVFAQTFVDRISFNLAAVKMVKKGRVDEWQVSEDVQAGDRMWCWS